MQGEFPPRHGLMRTDFLRNNLRILTQVRVRSQDIYIVILVRCGAVRMIRRIDAWLRGCILVVYMTLRALTPYKTSLLQHEFEFLKLLYGVVQLKADHPTSAVDYMY